VPEGMEEYTVVARSAVLSDAQFMLETVHDDEAQKQFAVYMAKWLGKDRTRKKQADNNEMTAVLEQYKLVACSQKGAKLDLAEVLKEWNENSAARAFAAFARESASPPRLGCIVCFLSVCPMNVPPEQRSVE